MKPPRRLRRRAGLVPGPLDAPPARRVRRGRWRAAGRLVLIVLFTLAAIPVQTVLISLPGRSWTGFARFYWAGIRRLLGISIRVIGTPVEGGARPVVFVSNHSSWVDIPVLGSQLTACFVAKSEVGNWPVIRTVARLGRSVFVSRRGTDTRRELELLRERLARGQNLILFPEGTTSDGARVLPFRSAFLALAEGADPPLLQPVSVVYDRLDYLPTGRAQRPLFSWYGDMDLLPHFWRLARHAGMRVTVVLHPPVDPANFANRKLLSQALWYQIAASAASLRQNRRVG